VLAVLAVFAAKKQPCPRSPPQEAWSFVESARLLFAVVERVNSE
jgi:hypothetical protein